MLDLEFRIPLYSLSDFHHPMSETMGQRDRDEEVVIQGRNGFFQFSSQDQNYERQ